ncbi:hypothetical protein FRACYDRAFT_255386 [Fragilariopsis cylindrus CCMP1102]|uniref:Uncharacterized protein n=1 Tax=Fragilariopsis cylindrus CCMP1102 TaxID=635003 RepID=A0A1E7EK12_9STRA|nr:hypothetical protein FRACYDRAFT_255386 [Fragilariopsis cylindrus CCMP1102]|eukprot:OEU06269.1 hypothetical protein FRACYDRAFT_255386 [Fragilariopsis cylindrus CCMP1102]
MDSSSQTIHPQVADEEPRRNQDEQQQSRSLLLSDGVIRAIFLLLGVGILIPWNAFVSAKPYFTARLCQASGQDIVNFEQWFGLVWNTSSVFSLGLLIFGQSFSDYWMKRQQGSLSNVDEINNNDDESNHSSSSNGSTSSTGDHSFYHVMVPLTIYATVFSVQAFLVTIPDISPTNFLIVTFVGLAICGTCGAIATAGIISTAGLFPSHIGINPFFSGQSLGGVVVSMANFGAAAVGEDPVDYLDKHCSSTNQTQEITATFNSIISTEIRRMDLYLPQEEPPSCSPYAARDWAVFSYFLLGSWTSVG